MALGVRSLLQAYMCQWHECDCRTGKLRRAYQTVNGQLFFTVNVRADAPATKVSATAAAKLFMVRYSEMDKWLG